MSIDGLALKVYINGESIVVISKGSAHQRYTPQEWDEEYTEDIGIDGFRPFPPAKEILTAWHDLYDFRPM